MNIIRNKINSIQFNSIQIVCGNIKVCNECICGFSVHQYKHTHTYILVYIPGVHA